MNAKQLRALILVQNLPVPFDRRVWQEATTLARAGWNVSVICPSNEKYPEGTYFLEGVLIKRFKAVKEARTPFGYVREYLQSLSRMSRARQNLRLEGKHDVLQFCNPPDLLAFLAVIPKFVDKTKIIFDQHDLGPELVKAKDFPLKWFFTFLAQAVERVAYLISDRVIATNESYKSIAIKRGHIKEENVFVVRSAPCGNWAAGASSSEIWRRGHDFQIAYLGVIGSQEGLHFALEAIKTLRDVHAKDVLFTVVGSGTDLQRMVELSQQLGVQNNVHFLGRLPDSEMQQVLKSADVCINPDVFSELNDLSTMNKIVEYMALGAPIVQFDLKEGRNTALSGSLYAEPNNSNDLAKKISDLLDDESLRREMSNFSLIRFREQLSWEHQVDALLRAYRF